MKPEQLADIFMRQAGARKEGPAYIIPADSEVTLFVALSGETLAAARVCRLEVEGGIVAAETHRAERYLFAIEDLRAVKVDRGEPSKRERGAGFGK